MPSTTRGLRELKGLLNTVSEHQRIGADIGAGLGIPEADTDENRQSGAAFNLNFPTDILGEVLDSILIVSLNADGSRGKDELTETSSSEGTPDSFLRQDF